VLAGDPHRIWERSSATPAAWRATAAFCAVAIGQVAALWLWERGAAPASGVWFGLALLMLAPGVAASAGPRGVWLACAAGLISAGSFTARVLEAPVGAVGVQLSRAMQAGGESLVTLEGVVLERARERPSEGALAPWVPFAARPSATFSVGVRRVVGDGGAAPASGVASVSVRGGVPEGAMRPGDWVRVTGMASLAEAPSNPGQPDARLWAGQRGTVVRLTVASAELIEPIAPDEGGAARAHRAWLRARDALKSRAAVVLPEAGNASPDGGGAMLAALLLGERTAGSSEVRATFARQGLAHVLAISGFHLAVMAGAAMFAVRLTGDRGRLEPVLVGLLVVLYVLVLPARAPIIRASSMVLIWLAAESLGRRYDRRALLAWVAVGVLAVRPMELFSLGYQLTFGITAALIWWGERFHARLFPASVRFEGYEPPDALQWRWWSERATRLVSASVLCWAVATPLVAREVGIVSPAAAITTVVVVPVVTVLLWMGFALMLAGVAWPGLAGGASWALERVSAVVLWLVRGADALPMTSVTVPPLSLGLAAAWTGLAAWWLLAGRWRRPGLWAVTLLACAWTAGEWRTAHRPAPGVVLRLDALDVGDGSCLLLRSGGEAVLWDCGSLRPDMGVRTLPRALRALGVVRVREVFISHADFDHFSALPDMLGGLGVRRVRVPEAFFGRARARPGGVAAALLERLEAAGVSVEAIGAGDSFSIGRAGARVLSPPEPSPFAAPNDNSLVVELSVPTAAGVRRVLLTGDAQREALAALLGADGAPRADVLELPHHGSVSPVALAFVEAVDPGVVVQSTGPSRARDVRWNELRAGRRWWTTATDGAVWVRIMNDGSVRSGSVRGRR
jgi:competence protein ComEC